MKKHSPSRKHRRVLRALHKTITRLNAKDTRRARMWNDAISAARAKKPYDHYFCIGMDHPVGWRGPNHFQDMFLEVSPNADVLTQKSGIFYVEGASSLSNCDVLLECQKVGSDSPYSEFIWFPRPGQRVVSAKEMETYDL